MSVEVSWRYQSEYRAWTIVIRSHREGPPPTSSVQEYVLPESLIETLVHHWNWNNDNRRMSARDSEAGAGSEGLALSTSRKSATPGPGESPAPPAETSRADTPSCEPDWSSEPLLTYWCNTHRRPGFRCEDEVKSRRQEDVLRAVVNLLETDLSGAPPRAADRDRNGNPTWTGLRRKILSEVQALISEGKK